MEQPKLINNISERVVDDLKQRLSKDTCVSIAAASFSIYAYIIKRHFQWKRTSSYSILKKAILILMEYALEGISNQLFAARYQLYLKSATCNILDIWGCGYLSKTTRFRKESL